MADIQYLNYGDLQIELLALLDKAANEVTNYVNSLPWSKKRKEKFMSAYSDIMTRGIKGASSDTGQWMLDVGEGETSFDSLNKKDQEIYQEAAYFIRSQMESIASAKKAEKDKIEKNKIKFTNDNFLKDFRKHITNSPFLGGQEFYIDPDENKDKWNYLDPRDSNGIRGRKNRAKKLSELLRSYSDSLTEDKYNFENSPFKDLSDFKTRIDSAIKALTESPDNAREALNSIGIDEKEWLNNGSGDPSGYKDKETGKELTYGELAERIALGGSSLEEPEEQESGDLPVALDTRGTISTISGIHSVEARTQPEAYREWASSDSVYGTGKEAFEKMNYRIRGLLEKGNSTGITKAEKKELGNLLYYIRTNNPNYIGLGWGLKTNITDLEWNEFLTHNKFSKSNKNNFVRLPWLMSDGKYVFADNLGNIHYVKPANNAKFNTVSTKRDEKYNNYLKNFLVSDLSKYLNTSLGEDFSEADIEELAAAAADIVSIANPEPFSAGALGLVAAGLRNRARYLQPGNWSLTDYLEQGADYLTGAIGGIDIFGDALLSWKVGKNAAKIIPKAKKALRLAARYDAFQELFNNAPGSYLALEKIASGDFDKLTKKDLRSLGEFIKGVAITRNLNLTNRATRKVLKERGYDISNLNSFAKKIGFHETKVPLKTAVKIRVNGKDEKAFISSKSKKELDRSLRKAGNREDLRNEAIRKVPEILQKYNVEKVTMAPYYSKMNIKWSKNFGPVPKTFRRIAKNYEEAVPELRNKSKDNFENYMKNRSYWEKLKYGSNRTLRSIDKFRLNHEERKEYVSPNTAKEGNFKTTNLFETPTKKTGIGNDNLYRRATIKRYHEIQNGKFSNKNMKDGSLTIGNEKVNVYSSSANGKPIISLFTSKGKKEFKNLEEAKREVARIVKELRYNILPGKKFDSESMKKLGETLLKLKLKGWLKQGGKITDTQINNFLRNYK